MTMNVPLLAHAAGLLFLYSLYGILRTCLFLMAQEKIFKSEYGPEQARFTSSSLLILINRLFSISAALAIVAGQRVLRRRSPADEVNTASSTGRFWTRVRPQHAMPAYAAVAFCNFLSSSCQYEALKYVSYTSQSLAKCAKMIPVILIGSCIYGKKHQTKDWVAVAVVSLGCFTYILAAGPGSGHAGHSPSDSQGSSAWASLIGTFLLCGYLFFDGLVSTTQERYFGKNKNPAAPFGPSSPVLDQMIWVNACAAVIALVTALASHSAGALLPNLSLMLTSPALLLDVLVFSFVAASGLIVLLNTIAGFGALVASTVMTVRQFLSIVINAGIFGNFGQVAIEGWVGVGWVASGVYIKMNQGANEGKKKPVHGEPLLGEEDAAEKTTNDEDTSAARSGHRSLSPLSRQYILPVLVPVALGLIFAPLLSSSSAASLHSSSTSTLSSYHGASRGFTVEGGEWAQQINALIPDDACPTELESVPHRVPSLGTAFASYPRSGNSYVRSLVERATGYQTSSIYCDRKLEKLFKGECDTESNFFVKTHYHDGQSPDIHYWDRWDKIVTVVRNPLDAVASYLQFSIASRNRGGENEHESKPVETYGAANRLEIEKLARRWASHARTIHNAPKLKHLARYEDIREAPVTHIMSMLAFVLPANELPPLARVACIARHDEHLEPYKSRKSRPFSSWDQWEPELRQYVLKVTQPWFCYWGYDQILIQERGADALPDGFCDSVDVSGSAV